MTQLYSKDLKNAKSIPDSEDFDTAVWFVPTTEDIELFETSIEPKYVDGKIVESASQEELDTLEQSKVEARYVKIDKRVTNLTYGAIAILLRLKGLDNQTLIARKELYQILYNNCVNNVNLDMIEAKRQLYNLDNNQDLDIQAYKALVIQEWNTLKAYFDKFLGMIETVRSKWKSFAPTIHNEKFVELEKLLDTITPKSQVADAIPLFTKIMNL